MNQLTSATLWKQNTLSFVHLVWCFHADVYLYKCEVLVLVCSGHIEMFVPATMSWKRIGMESAVVTDKQI